MPREYARSERMASHIQRELAGLLQHGLKDPRAANASVLEVEVSKDLAHARVFISVLDPADAPDCIDALNRAAGYLQREIGRTIKARVTPKLTFLYDDTDLRGRELSDLIDSAVAADRAKHRDQ